MKKGIKFFGFGSFFCECSNPPGSGKDTAETRVTIVRWNLKKRLGKTLVYYI